VVFTAESLTEEQIKGLRDKLRRVKRQNSYTRAIRRDCDGALSGIRVCKESVAAALNKLEGQQGPKEDQG
jgi:hypothetical protein